MILLGDSLWLTYKKRWKITIVHRSINWKWTSSIAMEEIISSRPHVMTWEWWELDGGNLSRSHLFPSDLVSSPTFDHGFEVLTWRGGHGIIWVNPDFIIFYMFTILKWVAYGIVLTTLRLISLLMTSLLMINYISLLEKIFLYHNISKPLPSGKRLHDYGKSSFLNG